MTNTITHALLSVSDKAGIVEFATGLTALNIQIISTGGTAQLLKQHQLPVIDIADYTNFPEMMAGRVKTLHPKIYAGILARPEQDQAILEQYNFPLIGLVVVNLYPFEQTVADPNNSLAEAIENIDIGGPTLLRAAAKNFNSTTVIVDQQDYEHVLLEISHSQNTTYTTRFELAKKVFAHVAKYDAAISNYFSSLISGKEVRNKFPATFTLQFEKKMALRYGENPHQEAAFYRSDNADVSSISHAVQHVGKPLSYNNIADADTALECVQQFAEPTCVIVKHANPCAVSLGNNILQAYETAYAMDPSSAFGGIIAFNRKLEQETLAKIISNQFVEVIVAPEVSPQALEFAQQKQNLRILTTGIFQMKPSYEFELKSVSGGLLIQDKDNQNNTPELEVVSQRQPTAQEMEDLLFAWQVVRFVKSNAIVFVKNKTTIGIGTGQMSRIFSTKIAQEKAQEAGFSIKTAVMASDAFFPFKDSIDQAAAVGISAIIQPGGSIRDQEVIEAANEHQLAMVFTHRRHFRH